MNYKKLIGISLILFCIVKPSSVFVLNAPDEYNEDESYALSMDGSHDDYNEEESNDKITKIFNAPMDRDDEEDLTGCSNIMCVPYYLCIGNMVILNGTDLFEWRMSTTPYRRNYGQSNACSDTELPCCADNIYSVLRNSGDDINNIPDFVSQYFNKEQDNNAIVGQCGYQFHQNRKITARAVQGADTIPMEFPWMVGVFTRMQSGKLQYIGGASIIHKNIILSAAHFLYSLKPEELVIRVGVHDILRAPNENDEYQQRSVSRLIIHNSLYAPGLINDIALIVISEPLKWNHFVNPICLPSHNQHTSTHAKCMASGWGKDGYGRSGTYQRKLKKIDLTIVENDACQRLLRSTRLGPYYRIDKSLLCAGGLGRDTCKGDGGSPLVCEMAKVKSRFYQCGIVAGGIGCGGHLPAMYVNVAHFTNWIKQQMRFLQLE